MKRLLIFIAVVCVSHIGCAATYDYLTFNLVDGTARALSAQGVKVTYDDGNVVAVNGTDVLTLPLSDVLSMQFTDNLPAGVETIQDAGNIVSVQQGKIRVMSTTDTSVTIMDFAGVVVDAFHTVSGCVTESKKLPSGIYVVKVGVDIFKMLL